MSTEYTSAGVTATIPSLSDTADVTKAFSDYHDDVAASLNTKAPLASPTFTGTVTMSGATVVLPANSVASSNIVDGTIVNADINPSAAIAYSKLNLAGSITSQDIADQTIVDADISPSAAISQSKISGLTSALSLLAPSANPTFTGTVNLSTATVNIADNALTQSKVSGLTAALASKANSSDITPLQSSISGLQTSLTALKNTIDYSAISSTSYTLQLSDAGKMIGFTSASAVTLTIPTNALVAFPINTRIDIYQYGSGQVSLSIAGITLRSKGNKTKVYGQYSAATIIKLNTDEWAFIGDIA